MFRLIIFIQVLGFSLAALAQDGSPLTFQSWKDQQVLDAQNGVLRVSARIAALRSAKPGAASIKDPAAIPSASSKIKKSEGDTVSAGEKDLRRAQESLQAANNLNLDDYITIYLPTLRDQPDALQALGQKMSKDELVEILKGLVRKDVSPDAKRSATSLAEGLTVTSRNKVQ